MITKLKVFLLSIVGSGLLLGAVAVMPAGAAAQDAITDGLRDGTCRVTGQGAEECGDADLEGAETSLNALITNIVNIISVIVAIVAVIMIIFGGFRYITSGGDSGKVSNAKNTIIYAIIGLVIVALAQFIVKFVLSKATGLSDGS